MPVSTDQNGQVFSENTAEESIEIVRQRTSSSSSSAHQQNQEMLRGSYVIGGLRHVSALSQSELEPNPSSANQNCGTGSAVAPASRLYN